MKYELSIKLPEQSERLFEFTKIPVFDSKETKEGRKGMLVIARDITEQKLNERILGFSLKHTST